MRLEEPSATAGRRGGRARPRFWLWPRTSQYGDPSPVTDHPHAASVRGEHRHGGGGGNQHWRSEDLAGRGQRERPPPAADARGERVEVDTGESRRGAGREQVGARAECDPVRPNCHSRSPRGRRVPECGRRRPADLDVDGHAVDGEEAWFAHRRDACGACLWRNPGMPDPSAPADRLGVLARSRCSRGSAPGSVESTVTRTSEPDNDANWTGTEVTDPWVRPLPGSMAGSVTCGSHPGCSR